MTIARSCPSRTALLAALALAAARPVHALDPRKLITQYGHDVWHVEDGLPQNGVKHVLQTRDGYLWLATEEGLARFDGVRFTVFDPANTPEMRVPLINWLFEDAAGRLWIGTHGGGLLRYHQGRFTAYGLATHPVLRVTAVAANGDGLWAGSGAGLLTLSGDALAIHPRSEEIGVGDATSMCTDRRGTVWIGSRRSGVVSLERDGTVRRRAAADGLSADLVWSVAESAQGGLWVGTDKGLDHIAADGTITRALAGETVRAVLEDRDGNLWVGTNDHGVKRRSRGRWHTFGPAEGLSGESVVSLHEDREGSLWLGTIARGLNRLRDGAMTTLGVREGLSGDYVTTVYQQPDGALWFGTKGHGANRLRGEQIFAVGGAPGSADDSISSFTMDRGGGLWLGTLRNGLHLWKDGRVKVFKTAEGLPHDSVVSLLARPDGSLWIGFRGGGLARFEDGRFFRYGPVQGLDSVYVWTIVEGRDGTLWLGTAKGLYALTGGTVRSVIQGQAVHPVHVDSEGVVWAGTDTAGLYRWKDGKANVITRAQGLFDNNIASIQQDGRGNLWMGGNKGIFSVSKQELHDVADGRRARVVATAYDTADGMRDRETTWGPSCKTADGKLWFPTIRGAVMVDPDDLRKNTVPPPVVVEEVVANGDRLDLASGRLLDVPPGEGRLQFQFTALSLIAPRKVRFAYRLDGFEAEWRDPGATRQASYTNLRPGTYTFRVKASNNDGVWNETGASLRVHLRPHFHQTPWFFALCVAGVAAAGWQGHRVRLRRLLEMERVRTRIAADLHDDVGSGLSQIAVLTGVARAQVGASAQAQESLAQIAGTAEELVDSMSDIVWAMNPGKDRLGDLVHRMRRFASEVSSARGIELVFRAQDLDESAAVEPDFRRHVYLIFKEAVTNAARHSGCSRVEVEIGAVHQALRLRVADDGRGFDQAEKIEGHGLGTMNARARALGGELAITSSPGAGTIVCAELRMKRR